MKNISELTSIVTYIFKQDAIPYRHFARNDIVNSIKSEFHFVEVESPFKLHDPAERKGIAFKGGQVELGDKLCFIDAIMFDDRKVLIVSKSTTKDGEKFFELFVEHVSNLPHVDEFSVNDILLATYETTSIVDLDFDYEKVFNTNLLNMLKKKTKSYSYADTTSVIPARFTMEVNFKQPEHSEEYKLSYAPKSITLEPRVGTSPKERRYFASTPTNTDNHLKLLKEIEKVLKSN